MEHAKSDEKGGVGFEKDVQKFTDNAEGTISLKEFLEQVGRCGERVAGNTGKRVYTGSAPDRRRGGASRLLHPGAGGGGGEAGCQPG